LFRSQFKEGFTGVFDLRYSVYFFRVFGVLLQVNPVPADSNLRNNTADILGKVFGSAEEIEELAKENQIG